MVVTRIRPTLTSFPDPFSSLWVLKAKRREMSWGRGCRNWNLDLLCTQFPLRRTAIGIATQCSSWKGVLLKGSSDNATIYQFRKIPLSKPTRLFSQSSRSSVGLERAAIARLAILFLHVVQLGWVLTSLWPLRDKMKKDGRITATAIFNLGFLKIEFLPFVLITDLRYSARIGLTVASPGGVF